MDVDAFINHVRNTEWYEDQIVHWQRIPGRERVEGKLRSPLSSNTIRALEEDGINSLFYHQAEAINLLASGKNVMVATSASSGKTLCYNIPVVETLSKNRLARAMYIFPTKALSQDQGRNLDNMVSKHRSLRHDIFDGDTPIIERSDIRRNSRILITNPDMLHLGILPNHKSWYAFLRDLEYVVIDEAHVYRGVFGSHVSNLLRRLRRICARLGAKPRFVLCSATIANPREHATNLTGLDFEVIEIDGSPSSGKDVVFWNPPPVDISEGSRRSTNGESARLTAELLRKRVRTMTFVRGRRQAELVHLYVKENLSRSDSVAAGRLAPYRGSYLPEDRRRIEKDLFDGNLLGLITTNAMELGIDVGDLDATIITGFPGTRASTWQQAGRSGRGNQDSLSMLIASDNPLDQYLMRHPDSFFGMNHERARISPTNPYIQKPHLLCAAYEFPLSMDDTEFFGADMLWNVDELVEDALLKVHEPNWFISPEVPYPAEEVKIRSIGNRTYTLVHEDSGVVLETIDEMGAFLQMHPGGIYLHQGESHLITEVDLQSCTVYCREVKVPYYTEVRDITETRILGEYKSRKAGNTTVYLGEVNVSTEVVGFRRRDKFTEAILNEEYVKLPILSYDTIAIWFDVPDGTLKYIRSRKLDLSGGLHAVEHAAISVLPLLAMCDRNDIGGISTPVHPDTGKPQVFIHDGQPGGIGLAELGYDQIEELWNITLKVIQECNCEDGCPGCIQSPKCGSNNMPLDKEVARTILQEIIAV